MLRKYIGEFDGNIHDMKKFNNDIELELHDLTFDDEIIFCNHTGTIEIYNTKTIWDYIARGELEELYLKIQDAIWNKEIKQQEELITKMNSPFEKEWRE